MSPKCLVLCGGNPRKGKKEALLSSCSAKEETHTQPARLLCGQTTARPPMARIRTRIFVPPAQSGRGLLSFSVPDQWAWGSGFLIEGLHLGVEAPRAHRSLILFSGRGSADVV